MVLFHLFTNWMILGNPFAFLVTALEIKPTVGPWYIDPKQVLMSRLLYPVFATFKNSYVSLGNISPLFLVFGLAAFNNTIRRKANWSVDLLRIAAVAVLTLGLWIWTSFTVAELRYVLFLWILLYMPVAEIASGVINGPNAVFRYLSKSVVVLLLAYFMLITIFIALDAYSPIDEQGVATCQDVDFCRIATATNKSALPGERILALHPYRYYLRKDLFLCSSGNEDYSQLSDLSRNDPQLFWREVHRRGFTVVTIQEDYALLHLQFGFLPDPENLPGWVRLEQIYQNREGLEIVYRVHINDPPITSELSCQQLPGGNWEVVPLSNEAD
jgi:hypothetical protein